MAMRRGSWIYPRPVHARFVVEKVALGQVLLRVFRVFLVSIIHLCSVLIFILILLDEAWGILQKACSFGMREHWIEKYLHLLALKD